MWIIFEVRWEKTRMYRVRGNHIQIILYEKNLFSIKEKEERKNTKEF